MDHMELGMVFNLRLETYLLSLALLLKTRLWWLRFSGDALNFVDDEMSHPCESF